MSKAFSNLSAGTAPFNEIDQFHGNAQRDDGEATDPEQARQRQLAEIAASLPDGFYMGTNMAGNPAVKPTLAYARDTLEEVRDIFDNRDLREDECDASDVVAALGRTYNAIAAHNEFAANGFLYSLERAHAQALANATRWVVIHAAAVQRHQDNGNEDAAENSLLNFETSKAQAFIEAAILDYCQDNGVDINLKRGTDGALNLAGWQLMNQDKSSANKESRQTTRSMLWNGRQQEEAADPADKLEASEEELDEAMH